MNRSLARCDLYSTCRRFKLWVSGIPSLGGRAYALKEWGVGVQGYQPSAALFQDPLTQI